MPTAEDVERPNCECHGEPMARNGRYWRCAVVNRARFRRRYANDPVFAERERARVMAHYRERGRGQRHAIEASRKARGVCVKCEQPLLSEALCWDCLNRMEERRT